MKVLRICTKGKVINAMIELEEKKKHLNYCTSFPSDPSPPPHPPPLSKKVEEALEESVSSGEIDIGQNIVLKGIYKNCF